MITQIVIFGASGDLAKRKTYPALFGLFRQGYLGDRFAVIGYARTDMALDEFHDRLRPFLQKFDVDGIDDFLEHCQYIHGAYDDDGDYRVKLKGALTDAALTIFYMALPPSIFLPVARMIRQWLYMPGNRLVIEKPFGRDSATSQELSDALRPLFSESEMFRIDHYLGKEMVKSLMVLRFANTFFDAIWNRNYIANVQVIFKESLGVEGRGGYYDEFGVIRDVLQNHMLQMLSIVAMERPASLDPEHIRDAKVQVLRRIKSLQRPDVLIGQYSRSLDGQMPGYTQDETVPSNSLTPTYAMAVCHIDNDRWRGVPFILRTGKGLDEQKSEIRIQFHDPPHLFTANDGSPLSRNELVMRVQPNEAVFIKLVTKKPGLEMQPLLTDLDLSYACRFEGFRIPDAYEALILDVLQGEQQNFVRSDELAEAWRIVTPVLHSIEANHEPPILYPAGSRGPKEADEWMEGLGYKRSKEEYYPWTP